MTIQNEDQAPHIAEAFYNAVIEGYEKYDTLKENPVWISLKSDLGELVHGLHHNSALLSQTYKPDRTVAAIADKLQATFSRIGNRTKELSSEDKLTQEQELEATKMEIYVYKASAIVRAIETDSGLDSGLVVKQANEQAKTVILEAGL